MINGGFMDPQLQDAMKVINTMRLRANANGQEHDLFRAALTLVEHALNDKLGDKKEGKEDADS
jgi:hypothetical protein